MGVLATALGAALGSAEETRPLHPQLEPFRPLLGQTWSGAFPDRPDGVKLVDVVRYERVLNGMAVRSTHSINAGIYGGETLFRWDAQAEQLVFHYFTTQGFMTKGTMTQGPAGTFTSLEIVEDPATADGVSQVKSVFTISADELVVESQFYKDGVWEPGHQAVYRLAASQDVVLK